MAETIKIAGELESVATGGKVVDVANVKDKNQNNKSQAEINAETSGTLAEHETAINGLNSQKYESVTATEQTTAVTDVLPATGEVDTIYRVGSWDGAQYDATCYSEYAWKGDAYVHLSTKSQIGEVFDISLHKASGGTLATFADLAAALGEDGENVPEDLQKGGMSVKFIQSSDNKYVQYRLISDSFTTDINQWQSIDNSIFTKTNFNPRENIEITKDNGLVLTSIDGEEIPNNENDISVCDDKGKEIVNINKSGVVVRGEFKVKGERPLYINDLNPQKVKEAFSVLEEQVSDINEILQDINVKEINSVSFPQASVQLLSNVDQDASTYEDIVVGYSNILKISDSLYYLYYSGMGTELGMSDTDQRLLFAYSTDGFNYTRGFPQGVTPPVSGTNLIADFCLREQHIFKVCDSEYPYRMIANDASYNMMMYKSSDAIHFDFEHGKKCCIGQRDCQVSAIVRGHVIKLFVRGWRSDEQHPAGTRAVTIAYCDIDGNIISPAPQWSLPYNSLYQAGASVLDDHRELLLPSFYNDPKPTSQRGGMGGDDSMSIQCFIVNGERSDEIIIDTSNILTSDDKAVYVMPNIIDINNDLYILFCTENRTHNAPYTNARSYLKLAKITLWNN